MSKEAIENGKIPMFRVEPRFFHRLESNVVAISFWMSKTINTKIPITANELVIADVVKIINVDVVTVDITNLSLI